MQRIINFILMLLKWPVALMMVCLTLPALKADLLLLYEGLTIQVLGLFFLPLLIMIVVWLLVPGIGGSSLSILEHELTHMLFAILTFHSPQDINVKRGVGGNFIYTGRGNWLISIAPYFFPTSAAFVIACGSLYYFTGQIPPTYYWVLLGIMTGYHLISTLDEIHLGQTDFKVAGYLFTILFLPGANLITYGFLLSYACYGFPGWSKYGQILYEQFFVFIHIFLN